jgi:hypothetical protein
LLVLGMWSDEMSSCESGAFEIVWNNWTTVTL